MRQLTWTSTMVNYRLTASHVFERLSMALIRHTRMLSGRPQFGSWCNLVVGFVPSLAESITEICQQQQMQLAAPLAQDSGTITQHPQQDKQSSGVGKPICIDVADSESDDDQQLQQGTGYRVGQTTGSVRRIGRCFKCRNCMLVWSNKTCQKADVNAPAYQRTAAEEAEYVARLLDLGIGLDTRLADVHAEFNRHRSAKTAAWQRMVQAVDGRKQMIHPVAPAAESRPRVQRRRSSGASGRTTPYSSRPPRAPVGSERARGVASSSGASTSGASGMHRVASAPSMSSDICEVNLQSDRGFLAVVDATHEIISKQVSGFYTTFVSSGLRLRLVAGELQAVPIVQNRDTLWPNPSQKSVFRDLVDRKLECVNRWCTGIPMHMWLGDQGATSCCMDNTVRMSHT